ncbi:MAG: hypothetical protein ACOYZ8_03470 [Chloroflexota bacterium]
MNRLRGVMFACFVLMLVSCQNTGTEPVLAPTGETVAPSSETPEPVAENYCLSCHTDKEELIETAKPEEVVEAESSGTG